MRWVLVAGFTIALSSSLHAAVADDSGADDDGFWFYTADPSPGTPAGTGRGSGDNAQHEVEVFSAGQLACNAAEAVDGLWVDFCDPEAISGTVNLTLGAIRTAFTRLDLPAGTLTIQPPDGLTLVNFDTNFFTTDTQPLTRTVTLLGQQVTIEATPDTFTWTFGDGEQLSTSDPGAAYPDLRVTHNYRLKDTYRPSLATTYTGRFRLGGGPWRQIPGTVTITGPSQPLRAIEATPKLVGY